jgi:hypothetical protein
MAMIFNLWRQERNDFLHASTPIHKIFQGLLDSLVEEEIVWEKNRGMRTLTLTFTFTGLGTNWSNSGGRSTGR